MSVLTIDKNLMKGLVAKSLPVVEETVLDIKNESIKVFLVSGYCNGKKVEGKYIAEKGDQVNPKFRSFRTILVKESKKNLMLEAIDTDALSVFNCTVASNVSGIKYIMQDSDMYYKALKVEVAFNYRIDDSVEALSKFLSMVGESSLQVNFLDKSNGYTFAKLRADIERAVIEAVKDALGSSRSISELGEKVEEGLNGELIRLLGQYGIAFSGVRVIPSEMGEDLLTPEMIAENNKLKAEAEKKEITTSEEINRHREGEVNNTDIQNEEHSNLLKKVRGEGEMIDAQTNAKKKLLEADTENQIIGTMPPPMLLLHLLDKHENLVLEMIKAADPRMGNALSGRRGGEAINLMIQAVLNMMASGRQTQPDQMDATGAEVKPLSKIHNESSKRKEGEIYDE